MSIIFDALQKTQQNREKKSSHFFKRIWWPNAILFLILIIQLGFLLFHAHPKSASRTATKGLPDTIPTQNLSAVTPAVAATVTNFKEKHILNGVYISEQEKVALIDNKFFHIGDLIDGMKIMSIETNHIKLMSRDNSLVVLSMGI